MTQRKRPPSSKADRPSSARPAGNTGTIGFVVVAAAIGLAVGWFARESTAKDAEMTTLEPEAVAPSGSAGPTPIAPTCQSWSKKICEQAGGKSEGCKAAQDASQFLSGPICQTALGHIGETMAKVKELRSVCDELVQKLCKELGEQTETCAMVKERTPQFPRTQCRQMMSNYDKVVEELTRMEKLKAPLPAELAEKQASAPGPSFGPENAKVVLVEYSDFQCPFCSKAATTVQQIKEEYGSVVRFVFRQFPLPNHPAAQLAAEAALAADAQGKFWAYHDLLFENQRALSRKDLESYAEKIGLNMAEFRKALDEGTYKAAVERDLELGKEVGLEGTPSLFIGVKRVANPTDFEAVKKLIDEQLKAAGAEVPAEAEATE